MQLQFLTLAFLAFASLSQGEGEVLEDLPVGGKGRPWINKLMTMPAPSHKIVKRAPGVVPLEVLQRVIEGDYCDRYRIDVYDIYFSDCTAPWVVSRCEDSPAAYSINAIASSIARIPVSARSTVRYYNFWPNHGGSAAAYSIFTDIHVFGEWLDSTILFHETAHNVDQWLAGDTYNAYSNSDEYQKIAATDKCVPTDYSKSSWAEHFAEVATDVFYTANYGKIPNGTSSCYKNILAHLEKKIGGPAKAFGECGFRLVSSPDVCVGPDARKKGQCKGVPDLEHDDSLRKREEEPVFEGNGNAKISERSVEEARKVGENFRRGHPKDFATVEQL